MQTLQQQLLVLSHVLPVHPQAPTLPLSILSIISYQLNITVSANVNRLSQVVTMAISFNCYYVAVQIYLNQNTPGIKKVAAKNLKKAVLKKM